ncbi:unnamed protein product [Orchesella dallaii]|uniref:Uncharacterized protein n=1 Tax=Orchesella dallaii TaxID=48710 RepID=A0ABP1QDX1_9HEXA
MAYLGFIIITSCLILTNDPFPIQEFSVEPTATAIFQGTNGKGAVPTVPPPASTTCSDCTASTCINCCSVSEAIDACPEDVPLGLSSACSLLSSVFTTNCALGVTACFCVSTLPRSSISYSVAALLATPSAILSDSMQTLATTDP